MDTSQLAQRNQDGPSVQGSQGLSGPSKPPMHPLKRAGLIASPLWLFAGGWLAHDYVHPRDSQQVIELHQPVESSTPRTFADESFADPFLLDPAYAPPVEEHGTLPRPFLDDFKTQPVDGNAPPVRLLDPIFQPYPDTTPSFDNFAPKLKVEHPAEARLILSPAYSRSREIENEDDKTIRPNPSFQIERIGNHNLVFPDFLVKQFYFPNPKLDKYRPLHESARPIALGPEYFHNYSPVPQFQVRIPGVKLSESIALTEDSGIKIGDPVTFPESLDYVVVGAPGFEQDFDKVFRAIRDIPPTEDVVFKLALRRGNEYFKLNIPDESNDSRQFNFNEQELRLRELVKQNKDNPEKIQELIRKFIAGILPNAQGWEPVDKEDAFIYIQPLNEDSNISNLIRGLSLDEMRELGLGQCELGSSFLYFILKDILPSAVAAGYVNTSAQGGLEFVPGGHARFVFESNGEVHQAESVPSSALRASFTGRDIHNDHYQKLVNGIERWRSTQDASLRTKLKEWIRKALVYALEHGLDEPRKVN